MILNNDDLSDIANKGHKNVTATIVCIQEEETYVGYNIILLSSGFSSFPTKKFRNKSNSF